MPKASSFASGDAERTRHEAQGQRRGREETDLEVAIGSARPRVGLLGNPSDGYGGRVLAFTFDDFRAEVRIEPAVGITLAPSASAPLELSGWRELLDGGAQAPEGGMIALLLAAARVFAEGGVATLGREHLSSSSPRRGLAIDAGSNIPRQVGLAGSSAIVIAALRALSNWHGVDLPPMLLARLALHAERDLLGIAAGPQDRVIQAHEGFLDMDFGDEAWRIDPLDPRRLPPLFVAWDLEPGESSGVTHEDLRRRWKAGDSEVRDAMKALGALAAEGRRTLEEGDLRSFMRTVDRNFDLRASLCRLTPAARRIVEIGRAAGAAVKFCGSGGAALGCVERAMDLQEVEGLYRAAGCGFLRPQPGPGIPEGAAS